MPYNFSAVAVVVVVVVVLVVVVIVVVVVDVFAVIYSKALPMANCRY